MGTDADWQEFGANNPYYGVLSAARFRGRTLDEQSYSEFFASGEDHVAAALSQLDRLCPGAPRLKALDFGCGVGRLAIPLARRFDLVVGVDISTAMLAEAKRNASRQNVANLRWVSRLDELTSERGTFSFVNSYIVMQHIACTRGLRAMGQLLDLLDGRGCGAVHFTYGRMRDAATLGQMPIALTFLRDVKRPIWQLLRKLRGLDPEMQMNAYSLSQVAYLLQTAGVRRFHAEFTDHAGHLGIVVYFCKS